MVGSKERGTRMPVIGWREWIALPDLGVDRIKVKVDTGARSSALHAFDAEEFDLDGQRMVRFAVHPVQRASKPVLWATAPVIDRRKVKDSGGHMEKRLVILTPIELLGVRFDIEVTLTRRDAMGFRMLLGRQAVRRRFLVDPGGSYYNGRGPAVSKRGRRDA